MRTCLHGREKTLKTKDGYNGVKHLENVIFGKCDMSYTINGVIAMTHNISNLKGAVVYWIGVVVISHVTKPISLLIFEQRINDVSG